MLASTSYQLEDVQWTPDLSTGENFIDIQHIELYRMVNVLVQGDKHGMPNAELKENIDFLQNYVVYHFGEEEKGMEKYNYPEMESHKKMHRDFVAAVESIAAPFSMQGDNSDLLHKLADVGLKWLDQHIRKQDTKLAAFFKQAAEQHGAAY